MARIKVVLPDPLAPTSATISPDEIDSDMASMMRRSLIKTERFFVDISSIILSALPFDQIQKKRGPEKGGKDTKFHFTCGWGKTDRYVC